MITMNAKTIKAIALFSGGLDSILAVRLVLEQGIEVEAVNFTSVFYPSLQTVSSIAKDLKIKLKVFEVSREFFKILKNPKHSYGSNLNPCIDCHIFMFKKAAEYMRRAGGQFLISGEVLGERPMSQNKNSLKLIEKEAGLKGFILRPLSAKLLEQTIAEKEGLIEREKLLSISGRSRRPQLQLAQRFGITNYPAPAGGCLLTDEGFSRRMRDLMQRKKFFTVSDVELLKVGRHFRLGERTKLAVGRNAEENDKLSKLARNRDHYFYSMKTKGPVGIGRGIFTKDYLSGAVRIMARYCDKDNDASRIKIGYRRLPDKTEDFIIASSMKEEELSLLRL